VKLTADEERMLAGEFGPGVQMAMDLLVKLGDSFGAERMARASYAHAIYDVIPEDFWDLITRGVKPLLKVTTHPAYQPEKWKEWGLTQGHRADEFIAEHQRKLKGCPRCGGDVFVENNSNGWHEQCLQCTYQRDLEIEPAFIRRPAPSLVSSRRELASVGSQ